jgi:hypothetical protein
MGGLAGVHRGLGDLLAFVGLLSAAAQAFADAVRASPDLDGYLRLGEALGRARRWGEAARAFEEAARLAPGSLLAQGGLALCLARAGRPLECLAVLDGFSRLRPYEAEPHLLRSALLLRLGRRSDALSAMRWAAQLPGPPAGRRFLLAEELLGAAAWEALLDRHRSARLLVGSRSGGGPGGRSALEAAPARLPEARPARRPRARRVRRGLWAWTSAAPTLTGAPWAFGRAAARGLLMLAARSLARRRPHIAIRSLRAACAFTPARRAT